MTTTSQGGSAAERVAALLLAFENPGPHGGNHSVSELARAVGRERSQVSRMLQSLARTGLVEQDPTTRTYRLGWNLRVLAAVSGDYLLTRACRPVLQALVARTGEVALLSVQEGNRSLTVLREESHQSLRAGGWVGRRSPMHCTASGRALLFDTPDDQIEALTAPDIDTTMSAPNAPTTVDALLRRIHREGRQGYSVASEEVEIGLTSVGVPIRDLDAQIVGVINISAPTSRIIDKVDAIGGLLLSAARNVSQALSSRRTPMTNPNQRSKPVG